MAKHVIGRFFVKAQAQGPKATVGGFHCVGTTPGSKFLVRCRDRHRRVRFHGGIGKGLSTRPALGKPEARRNRDSESAMIKLHRKAAPADAEGNCGDTTPTGAL
jgi:hypothetical protein